VADEHGSLDTEVLERANQQIGITDQPVFVPVQGTSAAMTRKVNSDDEEEPRQQAQGCHVGLALGRVAVSHNERKAATTDVHLHPVIAMEFAGAGRHDDGGGLEFNWPL
jgi:hypothetical protein